MSSRLVLLMMIGLMMVCVENGSGQEWTITEVDIDGDKPSLALDMDEVPHVIYFVGTAGDSHRIKHATIDDISGEFTSEEIFAFGFQEHTDIAIGTDNIPHVTYHSHFSGDLVHSWKVGGVWYNEFVDFEGHDGWSSSIAMDSENLPHVSYLDPSLRDPRAPGVEYLKFDGTAWSTEAVGSETALNWFHGTSIALDQSDKPYISYYDDIQQALMLASKEDSVWTIETVDTVGNTGRYSDMSIDANGFPRIAYVSYVSPTQGMIRLARFNGTTWSFLSVDTLYNLDFGVQPEDVVALDLDAQGVNHLAYCDTKTLVYATVSGNTVTTETVVDLRSTPNNLGQSAALDVDGTGRIHVAYLGPSSTPTSVLYAVRSFGFGPAVSDIPDQTITVGGRFTGLLMDNYVSDPDDPDADITWTFSGNVSLTLQYDPTRRRVKVRAPVGWTGSETIKFTATDPDENSDSDNATYTVNPALKSTSSSGEHAGIPEGVTLEENYPNPFNPSTVIRYGLDRDRHVRLSVHNTLGQEVVTLVNEVQPAGFHRVSWQGTNGAGEPVAAGIYFTRLSTEEAVLVSRMVLLK